MESQEENNGIWYSCLHHYSNTYKERALSFSAVLWKKKGKKISLFLFIWYLKFCPSPFPGFVCDWYNFVWQTQKTFLYLEIKKCFCLLSRTMATQGTTSDFYLICPCSSSCLLAGCANFRGNPLGRDWILSVKHLHNWIVLFFTD